MNYKEQEISEEELVEVMKQARIATGKGLKAIAKENSMTLKGMSDTMEYSYPHLGKIIKGEEKTIKLAAVSKLANKLNTTVPLMSLGYFKFDLRLKNKTYAAIATFDDEWKTRPENMCVRLGEPMGIKEVKSWEMLDSPNLDAIWSSILEWLYLYYSRSEIEANYEAELNGYNKSEVIPKLPSPLKELAIEVFGDDKLIKILLKMAREIKRFKED